MSAANNFYVYTGETLTVVVPVTNSAGEALPLAGYEIVWHLESPTPLVKTTAAGHITIVGDGASFTFTLSDTDTAALLAGSNAHIRSYGHEAKITSALGEVSVVVRGQCTVVRSLIET